MPVILGLSSLLHRKRWSQMVSNMYILTNEYTRSYCNEKLIRNTHPYNCMGRAFDKCPNRAGPPASLGVAGRGALIRPGSRGARRGLATPRDCANPAHFPRSPRRVRGTLLSQRSLPPESPVRRMLKKLSRVGASGGPRAAAEATAWRAGDGAALGGRGRRPSGCVAVELVSLCLMVSVRCMYHDNTKRCLVCDDPWIKVEKKPFCR